MNTHTLPFFLSFNYCYDTTVFAALTPKIAGFINAHKKLVILSDRLGRGVNFGNALDAPHEGDWGMVIQDDYFQHIKEAGFDTIGVPIFIYLKTVGQMATTARWFAITGFYSNTSRGLRKKAGVDDYLIAVTSAIQYN